MTKEEIKEFKKLVKWAKKNGLTEFTAGKYSFKLATVTEINTSNKTAKPEETDPALLTNDPSAGMPPDSELLYWSTDAFDSITESRKDDTPR